MGTGLGNQSILQVNLHQYGNSVLWFVFFDVGVCFLQHSNRTGSVGVHAVMGFLMAILNMSFILQMLYPSGFNINVSDAGILPYIHVIIGYTLFVFYAIQITLGILVRRFSAKAIIPPEQMLRVKTVHRAIGWFLAIVFKIDILWCWGFTIPLYVILVWETAFIAYLIHCKAFRKAAQAVSSSALLPSARSIASLNEIEKEYPQYVIFADRVYDLSPLFTTHPGGAAIINSIVKREVDRFLYGMYGPQLLSGKPIHSHSATAISILGFPIALYQPPCPYDGFITEVIDVQIAPLESVSQDIYLLKVKGLTFKGYTDVRQLGQYYSLTVNAKHTRLYTTVNLLTYNNILLMSKILPNLSLSTKIKKIKETPKVSQLIEVNDISNRMHIAEENSSFYGEQKDYLPIMIKSYQKGKVTSLLRTQQFVEARLQLSRPRGQGLHLSSMKPGRIIIVAGGTGSFPFLDFIDLLFKDMLVRQKHPLSQAILQQSPVLRKHPFDAFTVTLMLALVSTDDLHPLALRQIIGLSQEKGRFQAILRISDKTSTLSKQSTSLKFTKEYFTKLVVEEGLKGNLAKIWICGPPKLNSDTAQSLLQSHFSQDDFLFI